MQKIISYNVNGLRAALKKGLIEWLKTESPDIFCIQESKSQEGQVPAELFEDLGYKAYWHSAEKKGYSGVVTYSKKEPASVIKGMGIDKYDVEGRVLITKHEDFTLLNCYFPSGSSSEERHDFKMEFLKDFGEWVDVTFPNKEKLIVVGDYNVVRLDIDIHNPQRKDKPSGFRPEERAWLAEWFEKDFVDAFRVKYPEKPDVYSWWSYRAGSRQRNKGWRIDYVSLTNDLKDRIKDVKHLKDVQHSDHAAVVLTLD